MMTKEPDTVDYWRSAYYNLYADYLKLEEAHRQLEDMHAEVSVQYEQANEIACKVTEHWDDRGY